MEFTLDSPFIRDILKQEHARARDEIRTGTNKFRVILMEPGRQMLL
jgi:hypothetical protein